jgi:hypothetical protein
MNKFNIRKDLPSIKIDKEFISQLEKYILEDIPGITDIDKLLIQEKYSIEIVDTLGSGVFNNISEFPLSSFQDGTKKIKMGFSIYEKTYCSVNISFVTASSGSIIDISLDSNNPREKAQGIYNGIMDFINQNKTYNHIFHMFYIGILGGAGIGLLYLVFILALRKYFLWATIVFFVSFMIVSYSYYVPKLKPYSEFLTNRQKRNNKIFSFFIWGFISYLIFGLGFGLLKDLILK